MTIQVDVNPETEAGLIAKARSQGVPFGKTSGTTSERGFDRRFASPRRTDAGRVSSQLESIAEGSEKLPELPTEGFSRESFYDNRLDARDPVPGR